MNNTMYKTIRLKYELKLTFLKIHQSMSCAEIEKLKSVEDDKLKALGLG